MSSIGTGNGVRFGVLGLIVLAFCLLLASRWMAWYEWTVGDTSQRSGIRGPRLPHAPTSAMEDGGASAPEIEYAYGSWEGQNVIPAAMAVYLVFAAASSALCWVALLRAWPNQLTLEKGFLACFVGLWVWLGVLPLVGFGVLFRFGLFEALVQSSEVQVIRLDVTYVRFGLQGPLALLAGVLISAVAFLCSPKKAEPTSAQQT